MFSHETDKEKCASNYTKGLSASSNGNKHTAVSSKNQGFDSKTTVQLKPRNNIKGFISLDKFIDSKNKIKMDQNQADEPSNIVMANQKMTRNEGKKQVQSQQVNLVQQPHVLETKTRNHQPSTLNFQERSKKQLRSYVEIDQDGDTNILENPKLLMMILMFLFPTKDSLYYFLVRLNKKHGLAFLQKHYAFIDAYLPLRNNEQIEIQPLRTVQQHESGVN